MIGATHYTMFVNQNHQQNQLGTSRVPNAQLPSMLTPYMQKQEVVKATSSAIGQLKANLIFNGSGQSQSPLLFVRERPLLVKKKRKLQSKF